MVIRGGGGFEAFGGEPEELVLATHQDIVVDVQATSQHGGVADTAFVRSTIVTRDNVVTLSSTIPVFERDGQFTLQVAVPSSFVELDGDFTIALLLPRATEDYDVELVDWTQDYDPQVFDGNERYGEVLPRLGERIAIVWRGTGSIAEAIWKIIPPP